MAYVPTTWTDNDIVNAAAMNKIEQRAFLGNIFTETNAANAYKERTVTIPGITSMDQLDNIPIRIRAKADSSVPPQATLKINDLPVQQIQLLTSEGLNSMTSGLQAWCRPGSVYTLVWDAASGKLNQINYTPMHASTDGWGLGLVILTDDFENENQDYAATPQAIRNALELNSVTLTKVSTKISTFNYEIRKDKSGVVYLYIEVFIPANSLLSSGEIITTLPVGYRPLRKKTMYRCGITTNTATPTTTYPASISIGTDGSVTFNAGNASSTGVSGEGYLWVSFPTT